MCVYECPVDAISIQENVSVNIDADKCIGCGRCYRNCQAEAIERKEKV
ncbi:MAG: 4Fe-4S binding protein [Clostridia bacterium]|nr:4Fe-4S binding protein [Clostridia bacterium]